MTIENYVRIARVIMDVTKCSLNEAVNNPAIPEDAQEEVKQEIMRRYLN